MRVFKSSPIDVSTLADAKSYDAPKSPHLVLIGFKVRGSRPDESLIPSAEVCLGLREPPHSKAVANRKQPRGPGIKRGASLYDWSPDGRFLLWQGDQDLWIVPLSSTEKPYVFAGSRFNEAGGAFSPDGRWIAYSSNQSGRDEIYVKRFPDNGSQPIPISTAEARNPPGAGMAVSCSTRPPTGTSPPSPRSSAKPPRSSARR
jgi:hypothetical protein